MALKLLLLLFVFSSFVEGEKYIIAICVLLTLNKCFILLVHCLEELSYKKEKFQWKIETKTGE